MRLILRVTLTMCSGLMLAYSQSLPGLPSKGTKADIKPPIVRVQTQVVKEHPASSHEHALSDVARLIQEAQMLEQELATAGPGVLPVQSIKRSEHIEKLAKRLRGRLKK